MNDTEPSLGRRLAALFIDWVIAALGAFVVAGTPWPPRSLDESPSDTFIVTALFVGQVAILTGLLGVSIGKRLMRLRVENPSGRPIGIPRALLRTLLLTLIIPAIVMTDDKRGLHDLAAGSRVVRF